MKRDIYKQLKAWKHSSRRKPLILDGARQVGKTHALQYFAQAEYQSLVYLNFEKDENLASYFSDSLAPVDILKQLSIHAEIDIRPGETLLIFDEVQQCPRALNSLKYFCEEANEYHVVAAGSLLGIKTANDKGFPVGKVNFLKLFPMSYFEFITAMGHERLRDFLEDHVGFEPIPEAFHKRALELLKYYYYVGGMPEVVSEYVKNENIRVVREVQHEILDAYQRDFSKHAPKSQIAKIFVVWDQVHRQLAKENKKFIFAAIKKSARGRDYEEALQWLLDAGLIYKCYNTSSPKIPLDAYADLNIYKIYMLDVGLLGAMNNLSAKAIIEGNELFTEFKGSLTESFVAQSLISQQRKSLFYWSSGGAAELDFLIEFESEIFPLEVKAGNSKKKKSLLVYANKYPDACLSRATLMNLKQDGDIHNYPLYFIDRFPVRE